MNSNFWKLAVRNLLKRKGYALINVGGLCIGLVSFFLIMEFVVFERSYDTFQAFDNRIYRVGFDWGEVDHNGTNSSRYATNVPGMAPALMQEIPEIEAVTRFFRVTLFKPFCVFSYRDGDRIRYGENDENGFYADENFLNIFSFPVLEGSENPLDKPRSLVLSESFAKRIFGDVPHAEMIGKLIEIDNRNSDVFEVTAILEDVPPNSHIQFDYLISWSSLNNPGLDASIWWSQFYVYALARKDADRAAMERKFPALLRNLYGADSHIKIFLQPLKEIYLTSRLREEASPPGSKEQNSFLSLIAFGILFMAWINYVNMFTARSMERANEVGMKKVLGSGRWHLLLQFLSESFILNVVALMISGVIVLSIQHSFESWLGKDMSAVLIGEWRLILLTVGAVALASVLTAFYPAFVLSSYNPTQILGSKLKGSRAGAGLQKGLVYLQFLVSFFVVASTLIVGKQIAYMKSADIGVKLEDCIAVRTPGNIDSLYASQVAVFKKKMASYPFINTISVSSSAPGKAIVVSAGMKRFEGPELDGNNVFKIETDEKFLDALGIRLMAGRNFTDNKALELDKILINVATLQTLKFNSPEEAINKKVMWGRTEYEIIGVIANYNHLFLQESFEPIMLTFNEAPNGYLILKIKNGSDEQAIATARQEMQNIFPPNPFQYHSLPDGYSAQYARIEQFNWLTKYFAFTSIAIAGLGLFALSAYSMHKRSKEIAVRKVYGADRKDIIFLFMRPYLLMCAVTGVIGSIGCYFIMNNWLQNFAFAIRLAVGDFILPTLFLFIIVTIALAYNTIRATVVNLSHALKYE